MKIPNWLKKNFLLVVILVIAAILRFIAVKPGYNPYHADETAIWGSALDMVRKSTLDPGRYDYPATVMAMNFFLYKYFFIPISWAWYYLTRFWDIVEGTVKISPTEAEARRVFALYIAGERGVNAIFWSRYITAAFGVGTVFLTYLLSNKIFNRKIGLLAALFLTFNYRNVVNSHLALPDIYNSFFLLLSLIASWNLIQKPTRSSYLLAGIAAGLAFSVKYQIFALFPLVFAHLYLAFKNGFSLKKLFDKYFIGAGLTIPVIFSLTNPYFFIHLNIALEKMNEEVIKYGIGTNTLNLFPFSYLFHIDYGPPLFVLVILGIVVGLARKTFKSLFLLSVIVPIFYVFIYYSRGGFYVRNFIPVTPLLLIFASLATWQIIDPVIKRLGEKGRLLVLTPVLVAIIYVPATNSILSSYGFTQPWGYDVLRPWVQENLPTDVIVAVHPFDKANLSIKNKATEFAPSEAYALAEHIENGASFVVVDLNWASLPFYFWMSYGLDEVKELWGKPMGILRNTFYGLAAEELFRYQIHTVTKPWQSPDTHFVVVKTPEWPEVEMEEIKSFSFNKDQAGWEVYGNRKEEEKEKYQFDSKVGHGLPGSLVFLPGGVRFPTVRITSDPIPVKAGHLYKISGFLKTDRRLESKERDGFLRLDFYGDNVNLDEVGLTAAVSSRVYGTEEWIKKEIVGIPPDTAKYLTVSFQINGTAVTKAWLDDLVIEESVGVVDNPTDQAPYINNFVDPNYLYPNSHGNL